MGKEVNFKLLLTTQLAILILVVQAQVNSKPESTSVFSSNSKIDKDLRAYHVWIYLENSKESGTLFQVTDSSVWLVENQIIELYNPEKHHNYQIREYMVIDIQKLKTRKVKRVGRVGKNMALILGVTGSLGTYVSAYDGNEGSTQGALVLGFFVGGSYGLISGVIIGSIKDKYKINQNLESFLGYKEELLSKSYIR